MNFHNSKNLIRSSCMRFVLCCSGVGLLWLVLLPWLSRLEPFAKRLRWLDEKRIDAGAMYYTELEALQPVLQRMERQRPKD